jgi:thymidylate synthase ThyX
MYHAESFTPEERELLSRFFTNIDGPVFALVELPEVVKSALFARYSRSAKSLRRLFLDEFVRDAGGAIESIVAATKTGAQAPLDLAKATQLYEKIFVEYGDDSVAQLGGAHLACEQVSNVLTKVLERGRLASYLEQSTRYIYYDKPLGDRYRYFIPREYVAAGLEGEYRAVMDELFRVYSALQGGLSTYYEAAVPAAGEAPAARRAAIRARVCDDLRGLLPAATTSNLGIFASGQAYEALLLRLRSHPLAEARQYGELILDELKKVIPSFVKRVERPDRGGAWVDYLVGIHKDMTGAAARLVPEVAPGAEVTLTEWDPDAEAKIAAAALYEFSDLSDAESRRVADAMLAGERAALIASYVGDRKNRRHKPGRALERSFYRFDVVGDYGAFRDLQRHRLLTIEWQKLSPLHGYDVPPAISALSVEGDWHAAMRRAADFHARTRDAVGAEAAQYVVPLAFKIRFNMQLNAREAFHLLELRTAPAGHPAYRRICQEMFRLIRDQAGHRQLAEAMKFVDTSSYELGRMDAEQRSAQRAAAAPQSPPPNGV